MNRIVRPAGALLALATVTALAACAPDPDVDVVAASALDSASCEAEEGALRVYLNPFGATLSDQFSADTGLETEIADLGGGEILARIAAEANNPQWDVVVLDGHGSLQALADQGQLLTGLEPANLSNLTDDGRALLPDDASWFPFSQHAAAVLAYAVDATSADARAVVIAGGAVQTPTLLLRHRLGRPSGQLGRNFLCHPNAKMFGLFPYEIQGWKGVSQAGQIRELQDEGVVLGKITAILLRSAGADVEDLTNMPGSLSARQAQVQEAKAAVAAARDGRKASPAPPSSRSSPAGCSSGAGPAPRR